MKEKRAKLMTDLVNQIKSSIQNNKIPREVPNKTYIYNRLADYTYYSEVSIRKFLTGSVPKDISSFLNGIIKYAKIVRLDEEYIENFIKEYSEACNSIILGNMEKFKTKTNMPIQDFSNIIRTEKLTNHLNEFVKDEINMTYIYGYKMSGKTKSVMAYVYDLIPENIYENIVWIDIKKNDIEDKILDTILMFSSEENKIIEQDFKEKFTINFLKTRKSLIVIDFSDCIISKENLEVLKRISKYTKIIIISSNPFEKYEEDLLFYCKKFSIIEFMNKNEFYNMLNTYPSFTPLLTNNEEFVDKVYRLTGGFPFASIHIFKKIIEVNKYGESLEDIIKNYSEYKTDEYEVLASKIIAEAWDSLSILAKKILTVCSKFDYSISFKLVAKICKTNILELEWREALKECYEKDLITHIISNNPRLNMNNMIKVLVNSKANKEKVLNEAEFVQSIAEYYLDLAQNIGECYNEIDKLKQLDEIHEFNIILQVLDLLYSSQKYEEFIEIIRNLKYYIYVRGKWEKGKNSIHIRRAEAARIINNEEEELEAYCDYINIMSKSRNSEEAEQYLKIAESIVSEVKNRRILCLYNHVKALYLYNCLEEYQEAYELWKYNENNYFSYISEYRQLVNNLWSNRCYLKLEKNLNKVIELFKNKIDEMKAINFIRAQIDYELLLIAVLLKQYTLEKKEHFLEDAEEWLYKTNEMLENENNLDIRNEAAFYKLKTLIYAYRKDDKNKKIAFEKACELYEMMNCNKDIEMLKYDLEKIE